MLLAALLDELKHVLAPLFVFFFPRAKLKWPIFRCVALLLRTRSDYFQTDSDEEGPHHYIPRHRIIHMLLRLRLLSCEITSPLNSFVPCCTHHANKKAILTRRSKWPIPMHAYGNE
jgi:hypothetical protein